MGIFGSPQEQVDFDDLKARVTKLEAALASLQSQLAAGVGGGAVGGVPYGAAQGAAVSTGALPAEGTWLTEVRALKEAGETIHAIKLYREHTGVGLKEAKDAVEGMI
jgi:large subunit ribosomal protein L7/L12